MPITMSKTDLSALKIEAYWLVRPRQGELCDEMPPTLTQQHVAVRTIYSGFEVDTERLLFLGEGGREFGMGLLAPHCVGDFPAPIKFGDSCVGTVETGPEELLGKRVFVPHPHQSFFGIHQDALYELPDHVSNKQALLASEMLRALSAIWSVAPQSGERALVVGSGTVALLAAYLLTHHHSLEVEFCASTPMAALIANSLELKVVSYEQVTPNVTCCVHSSPFNDTLSWGISQLAPLGRAVDVSYHLSAQQAVQLTSRELTQGVTLSFVHPKATLGPLAHLSLRERYQSAIKLLGDSRLDALFDPHPVEFADLPEHVRELSLMGETLRYQRVRYPAVLRHINTGERARAPVPKRR